MTFTLLGKETESKFSKIASLCVMISGYTLMDVMQVLEILAQSIVKSHCRMAQSGNTFFSPPGSHVFEEMKTKSVYISN